MATERQIIANQINSQKSTGPKSDGGKKAVSTNAVKHGLLSKAAFIKGEDSYLFDELSQKMHSSLRPMDDIELMLVDQITAYMWRLRRIIQIEACLLNESGFELNTADTFEGKLANLFNSRVAGFTVLNRYEITIERSLYRALEELRIVQSGRP